jgi:hypothetical protein
MTSLEKKRYRWSNKLDVSQFVIGCFTRVEMRALGLIVIAKRLYSLVMMSSRSILLGHDLQALLQNYKKWAQCMKICSVYLDRK